MAIPRRGLQDIRTVTGKVGKATLPHEAYLRISHIEMEKARKLVESEKAKQLMADIATRLQEIESEKNRLLQEMGDREGAVLPTRTESLPKSSSFRIKY
ncbi:hypothetical protein [Desulfobacca acetoxidans]|uniref:Uncharacterized protein n=1 Tax=Desulfobacca acetoxidans (strain ATCC 700848 / DSM 11109 / ASRB2) TaxID=880072 RepID=F2NI00_DESAR|nr:hypothetical protein [Desulfobacca acetoxidans]AEB09626.1 hypothetical protein Desac_1786 [Desulfobacca acetoxidans DSM 11109]